ncbi:hypothetical protein DL991_33365 [Amycolatopsis sp. WAC 01375]|nr:hypothetical protein DL991_33365 [Amycolatopsis sp. WAC 01375]RSN34446.1 hypothetical protein DL990_12325 [Amycolatopsis sp. WAC 01416]
MNDPLLCDQGPDRLEHRDVLFGQHGKLRRGARPVRLFTDLVVPELRQCGSGAAFASIPPAIRTR